MERPHLFQRFLNTVKHMPKHLRSFLLGYTGFFGLGGLAGFLLRIFPSTAVPPFIIAALEWFPVIYISGGIFVLLLFIFFSGTQKVNNIFLDHANIENFVTGDVPLKEWLNDPDSAKRIRGIQYRNLLESSEYFQISKYHAKFSFHFSIFACSVGVILLAVAIAMALLEKSFQTAIIPIIGAAIAEFIAATVFWVHRKSAEQLNRYYDYLHEIEVFLSTVDIVQQISSVEKQDEAYAKILDELFDIQKEKIKAAQPIQYISQNKSEDKPSATTQNTKKDDTHANHHSLCPNVGPKAPCRRNDHRTGLGRLLRRH